MRALTVAALALALSGSSVLADTTAPLAPGKPAGVKQASMEGNGLLIAIGAAVVVAGIVIIATDSNNNKGSSASSTGTAP
jgi:hypothetical protein